MGRHVHPNSNCVRARSHGTEQKTCVETAVRQLRNLLQNSFAPFLLSRLYGNLFRDRGRGSNQFTLWFSAGCLDLRLLVARDCRLNDRGGRPRWLRWSWFDSEINRTSLDIAGALEWTRCLDPFRHDLHPAIGLAVTLKRRDLASELAFASTLRASPGSSDISCGFVTRPSHPSTPFTSIFQSVAGMPIAGTEIPVGIPAHDCSPPERPLEFASGFRETKDIKRKQSGLYPLFESEIRIACHRILIRL